MSLAYRWLVWRGGFSCGITTNNRPLRHRNSRFEYAKFLRVERGDEKIRVLQPGRSWICANTNGLGTYIAWVSP